MSERLEPGTRLGAYRLVFKLGVGGMGEVWAARRAGGKVVALKVVAGLGLGPEEERMFLDEAKLALTLRHPTIVQTLEVSHADGRAFIVMELIRGPAGSVLMRRAAEAQLRPSPAVIAHVGLQVARALVFAHDELSVHGKPLRLVHRDISPHNLLFDTEGKVFLTDFGVAHTSVQEHQTMAGTIKGKPAYMAPEQIKMEEPDQRSDLFSLGIVLYELATLERLFGRGSALASMKAVAEDPAPRVDSLVPGFPKAFADLIARLLEKDRSDRPASAQVVRDVLQPFVGKAGQPEAELTELIGRLFPPEIFDVERRIETAELDDATATIAEAARRDWPTTALAEPLAAPEARPKGTDVLAAPTVTPMPSPPKAPERRPPLLLVVGLTALLSSAISIAGTLAWVRSQSPKPELIARPEPEPIAEPAPPPQHIAEPRPEPEPPPPVRPPISPPEPPPAAQPEPEPEPVRPMRFVDNELGKQAAQHLRRGKQALFEGNLDRAEQELQSCLDQQPDQADCHKALSTLYKLKNDYDQAAYHAARYLELAPAKKGR